jgi:hypothetical protein
MVILNNSYQPQTLKDRGVVKSGENPVYITGKCKWARTFNPDPTYNKWSITIWPANNAELTKIHDLKAKGIRNELKKDDEGYYMTFSRPLKIQLRNGGVKAMTAPITLDKDGKALTELVGDGSDVTVKLDTYGGKGDYGKYFAARLDSIRVNNLIPYTKESMDEESKARVAPLEEQPQQDFSGW